jgi:hypothetical protein
MFIKNTAQKFANMSVYHEVVIPYGWMPLVGKSKASGGDGSFDCSKRIC